MGKNKNKGKTPKNSDRKNSKSQTRKEDLTKEEEVKTKVDEGIESKMEEAKQPAKSEEPSIASTTDASSRADAAKSKPEVAKPPPVGGKTFKELKAEADKKVPKNDSEDSFEMFEPDFGAAEIEDTTAADA